MVALVLLPVSFARAVLPNCLILTFFEEIKNPISLARLLLDYSAQPLSLRRVPPNFLAGQGATDFAYESGMTVVSSDFLVSPAAKDRWRRWRDDLERAERNRVREEMERYGMPSGRSQTDLTRYHASQDEQEQARRAHANAMRAALNNEAQPISPPPSDMRDLPDDYSLPSKSNSSLSLPAADNSSRTTPDLRQEYTDPIGPPGFFIGTVDPLTGSNKKAISPSSHTIGSHRSSNGGFLDNDTLDDTFQMDDLGERELPMPVSSPRSHRQLWNDGSSGSLSASSTVAIHNQRRAQSPMEVDRQGLNEKTLSPLSPTPFERKMETPTPKPLKPVDLVNDPFPLPPGSQRAERGWIGDEDRITDTVGAIAIDLYGNIACGASSGGIGMKHRGRIGPAALVGVGAAVKPEDPDDPERTSVATVTSGTGEHMSTTTAASVCSERMYHSVCKVAGGKHESCMEEEAMKGFIEKDFMGHSSVLQSHSTGAIGVLTVKKTKDGTYLYYGHNTDSFAMASMHSNENVPVCTMSRNKGNGQVAQGARSIRNRKRKV